MSNTAVIVDALRTPVGRYAGALKDVRPDNLAALVLKNLMDRNPQVSSAEIEDVLLGCANQAGEDNRNVARMATLLAGLPETVGGGTVNRLCGSGLMAINQAAHALSFGDGEILLAGGVESMSRAPYVMAKAEKAFKRPPPEMYDTTIGWRFTNPTLAKMHYPYGMGETAENLAEKYKITRDAQDAFALNSQQKAAAAIKAGKFDEEMISVSIPQRKGDPILVTTDEHPRPETTLADLAKLKPAFKQDGTGTVTAGNSSGINDGAAAVLMMTEDKAKSLGLKPMAKVIATSVAGVDPAIMGIGPVPATQKALKRAGLTLKDIGLIELNEAFAAQSLACLQDLDIDPKDDRLNVNGGAIALGHPLGCSGAKIMTTLLYEMRRQNIQYGLATMCIGVGQGITTVVENTN
ncbi:MAG: acetyl-CoA C-acyltransferase [Vampirovibrio sp.]|nr:acetyl-CoA C-acyltransferase [Vampirovibrio sp.]